MPDTGPQRVIAASNLVNTIGSGLYLTAGVLYFTEAAHLPATEVGLGLGIAGLVSLAAGIAVGHLADTRGARGVYATALVVQALATAGFVLADSFWPFVLAVCAATGAKAAGVAARSPIIRSYGGARPQEFRAYLRAVTNIGVSFGALLAGWAVQVGTHTAYELLVIGNAISFAASAAILVFLPAITPGPGVTGPRWIALRDRPYLLITGLDGIMAIQFKVLTVAIPLWLVQATTAPRWLISGTLPHLLLAALLIRRGTDLGRRDAAHERGGDPHRGRAVALRLGGSKCPSPSPPNTPPASTWAYSAWAPAWPKPSGRHCSSRSASPGAAPDGTSWEHCSP